MRGRQGGFEEFLDIRYAAPQDPFHHLNPTRLLVPRGGGARPED
ncbi:hypothetical protein [Streptomyces mirabilis]